MYKYMFFSVHAVYLFSEAGIPTNGQIVLLKDKNITYILYLKWKGYVFS